MLQALRRVLRLGALFMQCAMLEFLKIGAALRIPPSVVPDYQIQSFCAIMDTDFSGAVDIEASRNQPFLDKRTSFISIIVDVLRAGARGFHPG